MDIKELLKKYSVFILGLYFLAVGIVLIVRSALGTTPISSVNYVLSLNTPLSLGTWTFIVNVLLILGQFWLIRKDRSRQDTIEILLQIPFSCIFSAFIDFNMALTSNLHPSGYGMSMAITTHRMPHTIHRRSARNQTEGSYDECRSICKICIRCYNKEFGKFKVYFDVTLVTLAVLISLMFTQGIEGIREGSLIAACITGYIVSFLNKKIITRRMLYKLLPVLEIKNTIHLKKTSQNTKLLIYKTITLKHKTIVL